MEKDDARISQAGEQWMAEERYPQRDSEPEFRMRGQPASERTSVPPDRSQRDFSAAELLSNSVYLWACDESRSGTAPSRSDACAAWIILIIQMSCYTQVIWASSSKPEEFISSVELSDNLSASSAIMGNYSIVSVAVAMYLMTSFAATDLSAGIALLIEGRTFRPVRQTGANASVQDMNGRRWLQRKVLGLTLISLFGLLAAASITVLFKTSAEDVDLVVGAAAVLFIADVDEKAMCVLTAIPSDWRLFCVLEVVGLSVALGLLGLRATENVDAVRGEGHAGCRYGVDQAFTHGCGVYSWYFIVAVHPLSVTILSLLLNAIIASPERFFKKHVLESNSLQNWVFLSVLVSWVLEPILYNNGVYGSASAVLSFLFLSFYTLSISWRALFLCIRRCSGLSIASCTSVRRNNGSSTPIGLSLVPASLFSMIIILETAATIKEHTTSYVEPSDDILDIFLVTGAIFYALFGLWLLWGIFPGGNVVQDLTKETPVRAIRREADAESCCRELGQRFELTINLLFGWAQAKAWFAAFELVYGTIASMESPWLFLPLHATYWSAWIGVGVCAASTNEKGVAFWTVATWLLFGVSDFVSSWTVAKQSGSVE